MTRTQFSEQTAPALDVTWTAPAANGTTITGYEAQYRKKAADGEEAAEWTAYSGTLGPTATTFNLASLEAGATYEAQVRALSDEGAGPWSDTGEGTANTPPTASSAPFNGGSFPVGSIADYRETGQGALGVLFTDADSDTLTYSASAQHPALLGVSLSGAAGEAQLRVTLLNPGTSKVTYTASDSYGGQDIRTVTLIGTPKTVSRSVAENSAAGTAVGDPVTGTPYNNVALTYTLTGEATDAFVIDSATGQISVKEGATLDHETTSSYEGQVQYTVDGNSAVINVTINVTDVAPGKPAAPTVTRTQFSEKTAPALDVTWTAPAANGTTITDYEAQYRKKAADGEEAAEWTAYSGTLGPTATTFNLASLEAGATYEAQVRALSDEGVGPWSDTGESTANTPPNLTSWFLTDYTGAWGREITGPIDRVFEDADGDTLSYSASPDRPSVASVRMDGATFHINILNPAATTITYGAHDEYGGYASRTFRLTGSGNVTRSVPENSAAGTAVGDPVTGTPYGEETLTYTLTGEASTSGTFEINSSSGQISVKQGASLDYETKKSYTGQVNWTVQNQAMTASLTINITDVAPGKPERPDGDAVDDQPHDRAGRGLDGPCRQRQRLHHGLRRAIPREGRRGLDGSRLHRHADQYDTHRPDGRHDLRGPRAGN